MPDPTPLLRAAPVAGPRGQETLIELSVPPPSLGAIAIILDLSDSCAPMREELRRLPRLLECIPRQSPIWVHRLSSTRPVIADSITAAHLVDGTIQPNRWLDDRSIVANARARGSLIAPAIAGISQRRQTDRISHVTVLILTDGELLDIAAVPIPSELTLIGLTSELVPARLHHWKRVLPNIPLVRLGDPELNAALSAGASPFFGLCSIEVPATHLARFDPATRQITPLPNPSIKWNFIDGALRLAVTAQNQFDVLCTSLKSPASVQLASRSASALPREIVDAFTTAAQPQAADTTQLIADLTDPQSWKDAAIAAELADRHEPWISPDGRLRVFASSHITAHALLCLCSADPRTTAKPGRVLLLALHKDHKPALRWSPAKSPAFVKTPDEITIEYDRMENRWMLTTRSTTQELQPRGSQRIDIPCETPDASPWFVLFSGNLK